MHLTACGKKLFFNLLVLVLIVLYLFPEDRRKQVMSRVSGVHYDTTGFLSEPASVNVFEGR